VAREFKGDRVLAANTGHRLQSTENRKALCNNCGQDSTEKSWDIVFFLAGDSQASEFYTRMPTFRETLFHLCGEEIKSCDDITVTFNCLNLSCK
jgi:hypothetical protein